MVGDRQIRHRGTLGGSLVHGDPAADLPAAVAALGATLVVAGARPASAGSPPTDFFQGYFKTAVGEDEILTEVRVPRLAGVGWALREVHPPGQRLGDRRRGRGRRPGRAGQHGRDPDPGHRRRAGAGRRAPRPPRPPQLAAEGTNPVADMHADPDYRQHLARELTERALVTAAG